MSQEAFISDLVERLQQQIRGLLPRDALDSVVEQARRTLRQGFAELELVPRQELEAQFRALDELRRTVEDLERRLRELERRDGPGAP